MKIPVSTVKEEALGIDKARNSLGVRPLSHMSRVNKRNFRDGIKTADQARECVTNGNGGATPRSEVESLVKTS